MCGYVRGCVGMCVGVKNEGYKINTIIIYIMYKIEINIICYGVVYENEQRTACWGCEGCGGGGGSGDGIQASLKMGRRQNANHE